MTATAKNAATGRETTTSGVLPRQALLEKGRQPLGASAGVPGDEDLAERSPGSCEKNVPEPRGVEGAARIRPAPDGARLVVNGESGKDKPQQSVSPLRHGAELSFLTRDLKTKHKFSLAFDHQNQVAATGRYHIRYNYSLTPGLGFTGGGRLLRAGLVLSVFVCLSVSVPLSVSLPVFLYMCMGRWPSQ